MAAGSPVITRLAGAALAALVAIALAACGGGDGDEPPAAMKIIPADRLPAEILGLRVGQEDIGGNVSGPGRVYVDAVGLFSMRRDDTLQATLQVARFNDDARWADSGFRRSIVGGIATTRPIELRVGDDRVFLSRSPRQTLAIWFQDRYMYVLSSREEFEQPRALLRAVTELDVRA